jgi:hypothetical protein
MDLTKEDIVSTDIQEQLGAISARLDQLEIEADVAPIIGGKRDKLRTELMEIKKQVERLEKALPPA